jgi:hypothetical protein
MAKFCPNCGTGLVNAAKFCPACGMQIPSAPPIQPQFYPVALAPSPAKKKPKTLFIALGAAALVIALIVIIAVLGKGDPGSAPVTRPTTAAEALAPYPGGDGTATQPEVTSRTAATQANTKPTTATKQHRGNIGIEGLWLGSNWDSGSQSWRYVTFYEDGTFRFTLPRDGLSGFDKAQDKRNNQGRNIWGTYTFNGNKGTWKYDAANAQSTADITLEPDGGLNLGTAYSKFYRCYSVDGYRFDGAYTSYGNPSDPFLREPGTKPVIRFNSDGTFVDDGLFSMVSYLSIDESERQLAPGNGTYELKNYTLILRYSDNRTRQTSFTFSIGPNSKDASGYVLICDGFQLWKMP